LFFFTSTKKVLQAASSQMKLLKSVFSSKINIRQLGAYETRNLNDKVKKYGIPR